jgi:hypothetical protein
MKHTSTCWLLGFGCALFANIVFCAEKTPTDESGIGRYVGECVLDNQPLHIEFEVVKNRQYVGGYFDAILTLTPKKDGAAPLPPINLSGDVTKEMEPHRRSDRSPPVFKRHFKFYVTRVKGENNARERINLTLTENGRELSGTLEMVKLTPDLANPTISAAVRLTPEQAGAQSQPTESETVSGPSLAAIDAHDIAGVYSGNYIAEKREFSIELSVTRKATAKELFAILTLYVGAAGSQPLGSYRMNGEFDPAANTFKFTPDRWIGNAAGRQVGLNGSFDSATGKLQGETTPDKGTFELARDAQKTAALQAKAAAEVRKFNEAPVSLAAAKSDEARTATLVRWFSRLKREYPEIDLHHTVLDKLYPKVVNLFNDDDFVPVFGKPFDSLSLEERTYFRQTGFRLFTSGPNRDLIDGFVDFLFLRPFEERGQGNYSFTDIAAQIAFRRGVTKKWRAALDHLKELPAGSAGFDDILATKRQGEETFADLWPSQIKEFQDAVDKAKRRIADSALTERVATAVTGATGTQDPSVLSLLLSRNPELFELASPNAKNEADEKINNAVAALLEKDEQARPIPGSGLAAVAAGNEWYKRLQGAYGFAFDRAPVKQAIEKLTSRRAADLSGTVPTITAEISQQQGESDIKRVRDTYLAVAGDESTEAGKKISEAMEARIAGLKREAALQRFSPNERKLVQADLTVAIPDPVPEPDDDDLRVAVVRTLEIMGGKRIRPYVVEWHDFIGNQFGFYVVVTVNSARRSSCTREGTGYKVDYFLEIACSNPPSMNFGSDSTFGQMTADLRQAFQEQLEGDRHDHFELGKSGWWSPSMKQKGIISGNPY